MLTVEILDRVLFGDRWSNVPGKIEEAEGGTLLLTEVEDLTPVAQERLAKVLTDGRYTTACGDTRILSCRIIATGNRAVVEKAVRTGAFSSELFSMLSQETIRMPSLDERREDIPELAMTILRGLADRERIDVPSVPYHYLELLTHVAYSENVRQLRNHIESVMVLSGGEFDPAIIREHFIPETSTGTLKGALQALWSKFQSGAAEPVLTRR